MNIVILGAGTIGSYLAAALSQENHNVIVIDTNLKALEKIAKSADVGIRYGSGTDWQILEELAQMPPQLFVAVTSDDETNLVACLLAKNLGYPKTVARVRKKQYIHSSRIPFNRLFSVDHIIGTEQIEAHDILKCILHPGNIAVETFAHGAVEMRTIVIPPDWKYAKKPIIELPFCENILVGLIQRKNLVGDSIIFPRGGDVLLPGDEITLVGETEMLEHSQPYFGISEKKIRSVAIMGGTSVAVEVVRLLEESKIHATLIEKDEEICRKIAEELSNCTILNQDGTDPRFLSAEKIAHFDVFAACTFNNETNILAAMLAKQQGCEQVIALISDESYIPLLKEHGILCTLSEKVSVTNRILALVHQKKVIAVTSLYENQAKILEIQVTPESEIIGIPISDLRAYLPPDFLIAMIENRGRIIIPKGNHILTPGDTSIVITRPKNIAAMEKIF